jgi:hypothetical protein
MVPPGSEHNYIFYKWLSIIHREWSATKRVAGLLLSQNRWSFYQLTIKNIAMLAGDTLDG